MIKKKKLPQTSTNHLCAASLDSFAGIKVFADYPVPSVFFNAKSGEIFFWNQATTDLTGYEANHFQHIDDFINVLIPNIETGDLFKKLLLLPMQDKDTQYAPVTCMSSSGKPYVAELQFWQTFSDDYPPHSRVLHLLKLSSDDPVVEHLHKYSEELGLRFQESSTELARHKKWLEMALEGSREGLWTIDFRSGKEEIACENVLHMLGYEAGDIDNSLVTWDGITHPEDLPVVQERLQAHLEGKTPYYESEYRAKSKDGQWRWILGHGRVISRDENNKPLEVVGTHIDIDRLKRTEEELRRSENLFRTLVENAPLGLVLLSSVGEILYLNPEFEKLFGYTQAEVVNIADWWELACPDTKDRSVLLKNLRETDGKPFLTDVACKDGSHKHVRVQLVTLNDQSSFIAYEDVTAQKFYERALLKREKELHEKSEKLEEMNSALRVILNRVNSDREEVENRVYANIRDLVMPYIDKLNTIMHNDVHKAYLNMVKTNLDNIVSTFAIQLTKQNINLTPREIQIANMINEDMTNKDIAAVLYISESSVEFHRHNIRKKLGIVDKKINLKTYLRGIL